MAFKVRAVRRRNSVEDQPRKVYFARSKMAIQLPAPQLLIDLSFRQRGYMNAHHGLP